MFVGLEVCVVSDYVDGTVRCGVLSLERIL